MKIILRKVIKTDESFLWDMLFYAAHKEEETTTSIDQLKQHSMLSKYVKEWGRKGDLGIIAIDQTTNEQLVGAAWLRLFTENDKSYGYLDSQTPELVIGIIPSHRGIGIGTMLISELMKVAAEMYNSISLSVRETNPAVQLYQRFGFVKVDSTDIVNRVGGISFIMRKSFDNSKENNI